MTERVPSPPRTPFTIPLAEGPLAAWFDRGIAIVVAGTAAAAAAVLVRITPDPRGFDTHVQLGMAPCGWPLAYGIPCPTCGCTTAACQLVHGQLLQAFVTQPFGAALALAGLFAGVHALYCLVRRRSFVDLLVRLPFWRIVAGAALLLLGSWWYKYLVFAP